MSGGNGMIQRLNGHVAYCEGDDSKGPCPKIGIVSGDVASLFVDVSSQEAHLKEALDFLAKENLAPLRYVVLTHFHPDHTAALVYLKEKASLLASKNTARYLSTSVTLVKGDLSLDLGGFSVQVLAVPSLHAKGCLDVKAGDFLFVGDALYSRENKDGWYYNREIMVEEIKKYQVIDFIETIPAHDSPRQKKDEVLGDLHKTLLRGCYEE
jgi:glyoxylase-like metal-dependent hydrolase (beta-lactamase superfamily II)